jgi:IS30 family transposase
VGKLLRTHVVGLATECSPKHLNIVLVDFKGGGAFDVVRDLPHVVGMITDLDEVLVARALVSLRTGRTLRKTRRTTERRGNMAGMVNIAERPAEADDRAVPGHWEGDLITGKENKSAIGTLVERSTGYLLLLHLPDRHGADDVETAMIETMSQLPETLRRTLTWDQGNEMANHVAIADAAELDIYFCDPHSPWQRGTNENTNGLLRQYFPKSTDLSGYHRDYLDFVAAQLNNWPRKRLEWHTPAEALDQLLSEEQNPPGVATTS